MRVFIVLGAINMLVAVLLGAFGAHALRARLSADWLAIWQTGVHYQMVHALGLLALAFLLDRTGAAPFRAAGWLMFAGIVLFSGSLYLLVLTQVRLLGAVTPIGGLAFLAAWAWTAYGAWRWL